MIRAEFQIVIAGVSSLLAAMGISGSGAPETAAAPAAYAAITETNGEGIREITRAADGLFYLSVRVNGEPVRFLVDTGANVTVLTPQDAMRSGLAVGRSEHRALKTAGGTTSAGWATVEMLEVAGRRISGVDAAVVEDGPPVSLLGQDVLSRLGSITLSGDRLTIN